MGDEASAATGEALPQVERRIAAPGPPAFGGGTQLPGAADAHGLVQAQVRIRQRVTIAERAQGHVLGGPGTNAGQSLQRLANRAAVLAGVEPQITVRDRPRQRQDGVCAPAGESARDQR